MNIKYLKWSHFFLIGISVFLLPFVNSVGTSDGTGKSISIYPLIGGIMIWLLFGKSVKIPKNGGINLYFAFIAMTMVSFLANFVDIVYLSSNNINGLSNFIFREFTTMLYLAVSIYVYNYLQINGNLKLKNIERILICSFCVSALYSAFEILHIFKPEYTYILQAIDAMFRGDSYVYFKVRSLTFEASTLGLYLCIVYPVLLVRVLNDKKYLLLLCTLYVMALASMSRTVYAILLIQSILFVYLYNVNKKEILKLMILLGVLLEYLYVYIVNDTWMSEVNFGDVLISLFDTEDSHRIGSNLMRYGSQIAALSIFFDNPLFGVGLGQTSFYMYDYVPSWIWGSPDMEKFKNNIPVFGVYYRLLSDVGVLGTIMWLSVWGKSISLLLKSSKRIYYNYQWLIIIIGLLLNGFNWDSLSYSGYWISLGISWYLINDNRNRDVLPCEKRTESK